MMTTLSPLSYGSTRMLLHYALALKAAGHDVDVAYEVAPSQEERVRNSILPELESNGIVAIHVPRLSWAVIPIPGDRLTQVVRSRKSELIIASQLRDAAAAMSVARRCRVRGIVFAQGAAFFRGSAPVRLMKKRLYQKAVRKIATKVICVASGVQTRLIQFLQVPGEKTIVIPNGLDLEDVPCADSRHRPEVRSEFGLGSDDFMFLNIGRFDRVKGLDILVKAVHHLVNGKHELPRENFKVVIAAEAYSRLTAACRDDLFAMIEQLQVGDRFQFVGFREDCNRLLQAADCFVLPSRTEGLPLVVLEAFAAQCPVIMSEYGERFSGFRNNMDGVYVPVEAP
ncbi:MAG: glycosyltransferase family 4 protein [Planctomycetaceae bacterium]